jgi:predicted MFS family arabinose efflux permease
MLYLSIYLINLGLAVVTMLVTYWMANNEVKPGRRGCLAFLSFCCTVEVAILAFYVPVWHPEYSDEQMVTLLFAKFVLKPGLMAVAIFDLIDMRSKIRRSIPHGQVVALATPLAKETVEQNQVAAAKGKLDQAVDVAHKLEDDAIAKTLNDSKELRRREGTA